MSDPAALRRAADRLVHHAAQLPDVLDPVAAASGPHVWRGPAAAAFAGGLTVHRNRLRTAAADLRAGAARLRRLADELERAGQSAEVNR